MHPMLNIAPTMVWVIWWVGLAVVSAFVGDLWALINPWRTLFAWAEAVHRRLGGGAGLSLGLAYPQALGVWPAVALLLGQLVDRIQREQQLPAMAHLTCVNATRAETETILAQARALGVRNILALRGDPPDGAAFTPTPDGFEYSYQLVQFVHAAGDFSIGVAGFPEGHIACTEGRHIDWSRLAHKIEQGAEKVKEVIEKMD